MGGLEKYFFHWHCRKIVFHKMSISNRFQHLVALKSPKTLNSYFAPQRHHVAKLRKIRQSNCSIFYKACNTGQFLSSNEKILFKDWDEKQFFVGIRVGFLSIASRVSIFKRNPYYLHRSSFWILRLNISSEFAWAFWVLLSGPQYSKGTPM